MVMGFKRKETKRRRERVGRANNETTEKTRTGRERGAGAVVIPSQLYSSYPLGHSVTELHLEETGKHIPLPQLNKSGRFSAQSLSVVVVMQYVSG